MQKWINLTDHKEPVIDFEKGYQNEISDVMDSFDSPEKITSQIIPELISELKNATYDPEN